MGAQVTFTPCVASSPMDFETMRQIRNQCREFLTGNTAEVSVVEQRAFALSCNDKLVPYLYLLPPATFIGYGLRRWDADHRWWWLTGCLVESHRGRGYGRQLFSHLLVASAPEPVGLEVRITNLPARKLYESMGFAEVSRRQDILTMTRNT